MYRLAPRGVIRIADNLHITPDMIEWQEYRQWRRDGGVAEPLPVPPGPTLADVEDKLKTRITEKRDAVQYGGTTINGVALKTDQCSISLLGDALVFSGRKPQRVFQVKTAARKHVPMTAAQIADVFDALGERLALCWDAEAAHYAAVDAIVDGAGTDAEKMALVQDYDFSAGWPA
jgi:hypothetical protein